jgi:hypothetical protein
MASLPKKPAYKEISRWEDFITIKGPTEIQPVHRQYGDACRKAESAQGKRKREGGT